jgi:MFS family permease
MGNPDAGLTGSVVAVYIAGEAVGALIQTFVGDKLGRIRFMQTMCIVVTIGVVIQTAAVNMGMFLAGRALAGMGVGGMVGTVPIYLSEISAPHQRGLIGGISGCGISFGKKYRCVLRRPLLESPVPRRLQWTMVEIC